MGIDFGHRKQTKADISADIEMTRERITRNQSRKVQLEILIEQDWERIKKLGVERDIAID